MSRSEQRAALILQVRSGQLTAEQAARQLGVSRQTYYKWEQRALQAMLSALEDQPKGRPKGESDPDKETLQARVTELEEQVQLFQEREKLRDMVNEIMKAGKKNAK
jgi:transposase-like protein